MSDPFPVFGPNGKLLGNLTGNYGQDPVAALPDISKTLDSAKETISKTATTAGIKGATGAAPSTDIDATAGGSGGIASQLGPVLVRAIVVLLGFVFVGVGLTMFKPASIIERVTR